MDLIERLADKINTLDLPQMMIIDHLNSSSDFGIYMQPGSRVISEDWSGIQERLLPFEIAFRTDDFELGSNTLWKISELLDSINSIETDGTYEFNKLNIEPQPFSINVDVSNKGIFLLDFSVEITQKIKLGE
ncbi:minor capsid protein [Leuconostoc kimchii IMSNU 11154]|uniref:Minor capsid protein n=1 Tax=Leuconostoc kimchii (strain IMSNU 11154 / KCTC 2386 / IH25) TaxID=762051 RepID=D5T4K9_LEUKI|nr:phage capsid protein [Leuconostoc kimchii]ADG41480.1 minor capsid protein [Leuconostoc kimchii IMSNU 11154]